MNWAKKALILRVCAALPGSGACYKFLQKKLGRLSDSPETRLPAALEMAQWLKDAGKPVVGSTFFEVGTGHSPTLPICFSLMGAEKVITADLYPRMDYALLQRLLHRFSEGREGYSERLAEFADPALLQARFDTLDRLKDSPREFLEAMAIEYLAPCDASASGLAAGSIDCHISNTVFEHIPAAVLSAILVEGHRLMKDDGVAVHFIDPSDHFQHQDASISRTNFLRFSAEEWDRIAGNPFAYTNRLRRSELVRIFSDAGLPPSREECHVDSEGLADDFPLHPMYADFDREDLCTLTVNLLAKKR